MALPTPPFHRAVLLLGSSLGLALVVAPGTALASLSIKVPLTTTSLSNLTHTSLAITASCATGTLVGGGSYVRNTASPLSVPSEGLTLFGSMPSDGLGAPVADGTLNPNSWTTVAGFAGKSETGDEATQYTMCATSGGPSGTKVKVVTTTGANATPEVSVPTITTATCVSGRLVGGGTLENTPNQKNDGSTSGNLGNLKPLASYPSDSSGVPSSNGAMNPTSWSAYGSAGMPASTDAITAFAICNTDTSPPTITVRRTDSAGSNGQLLDTVTTATATCLMADGQMASGGFRVDETVGTTGGLQPEKGYHMRGSYPVDSSGADLTNNALNPPTWKTLLQSGGHTLGASNHMNTKSFALCSG